MRHTQIHNFGVLRQVYRGYKLQICDGKVTVRSAEDCSGDALIMPAGLSMFATGPVSNGRQRT